jgi:hypothetical protein
MGVLKEHGGLFDVDIVTKLISFGVDGVNFFRRCTMVLFAKCKISVPPIWKAFIALHQSSCAKFVPNPYCEIYRRFIVVFVFFFFSQLEKAS